MCTKKCNWTAAASNERSRQQYSRLKMQQNHICIFPQPTFFCNNNELFTTIMKFLKQWWGFCTNNELFTTIMSLLQQQRGVCNNNEVGSEKGGCQLIAVKFALISSSQKYCCTFHTTSRRKNFTWLIKWKNRANLTLALFFLLIYHL